MKRVSVIFLLSASILVTGLATETNAQRHGRGNGHGNHSGGNRHDNHDWKYEKHGNGHGHDRNNHREHDRHYHHRDHGHGHGHHTGSHRVIVERHPVYSHHHTHHCDHRIVVRNYHRPRYVYYRDYDVYFDVHRNVYITYSGRNWSISAGLPVHMHHVNLRQAVCHEVNYYDDDFVAYLGYGEPMYGKVYTRR